MFKLHKKCVAQLYKVRKLSLGHIFYLDLLFLLCYYYRAESCSHGQIIKEKNMKTKIFCLLVALVGVIAMLASCNGDPPPGPDGDGDYNWNKTTLIFELTRNTSGDELSSELERYLVGADYTNTEDIDDMVRERNELATTTTNVDVRYTYVANTDKYGWGANVDRIHTEVYSGAAQKPDMYCNFAYDLTCAALKGSFANLNSTEYGEGRNYFEFTKEGYVEDYEAALEESESSFDSSIGNGYFYDYMRSLSLSDDKLYCLASDYCTDLVRAFLVIPVNINLMNSIDVSDSTGDLDDDGDFDITDFYKLVWKGDFTYDAVARLSAGVYSDENGDGKMNFGDYLGFAAGTDSGLVSAGLLYTTSVKIINKIPHTNPETGKTYPYSYPATNDALSEFADNLSNLFTKTGVVSVTTQDVLSQSSTAGLDDLLGIRASFAKNMILFGGVIAVGSLEDTVYQEMRDDADGGFGIAPVPLYKASTADEPQEYLTLVHNIARIIAISATTTKFEQCSAFLNYQSTESADIINEYYNEQLTNSVNTGAAGSDNVKMLDYIRNHVRNCFDKTYEDAVSRYKLAEDNQSMEHRWHQVLSRNHFRVANIRTEYESRYSDKQRYLEDIIDEWEKLK